MIGALTVFTKYPTERNLTLLLYEREAFTLMNIPDRGEGRNKQKIQYVYRGRKGTGEDNSMHKKRFN